MLVLPVVERELRVAARRRAAHWTRLAAAMAATAVAAFELNTGGRPNGAALFQLVSVVAFAYAAIAGVVMTSDSLSEEKREATFGLLFLTDLKGSDIILGKLAATCTNVLYGLLAVTPVLAISWLFGGVSAAQVIEVTLSAIAVLMLCAAIGLTMSSLCQEANRALALASISASAMLVCGGAACCLSALAHFNWQWNLLSLSLTTSMAAGFFALACWLVPRIRQENEKAARTKKETIRHKAERWLMEINPFFWRASGTRTASRTGPWIVFGCACFGALFTALLNGHLNSTADVLFLIAGATVLKMWLAGEASCTFADDRRSGAMELLLTSPLSAKQIIDGQRESLWRQFAGPVTALLALNFLMALFEIDGQSWERRQVIIWTHAIVGGCLVLEMLALTWVGMWMGLANKKPNRALLGAIGRILGLPYLIFFGAMFVYSTAGPMGRVDWTGLLIFPSLLGLATNFFFALEGHSRLRKDFRVVVSEGIVPPVRLDEQETESAA